MQAVKSEQPMLDQTDWLYENMCKMRNLAKYQVAGLKQQRQFKTLQLANAKAGNKALRSAGRLIKGNPQQLALVEMAIEEILAGHHTLMMDEPFSGLDPFSKRKVQALIQKVADLDDRNSIVIVSHDITAVAAVSDHVWVLGRDRDSSGRVVPGAYIVMTYNLIDMGMAWDPEILTNPKLVEFVKEIDGKFGEL